MKLSKLTKVDLREVWKHEARDFSDWLSKPENLAALSDEIGIDLELIQTEASVGKFSVDVLAREPMTDRKVIIENQLEISDHDHLGKVVTYASGYDAEVIIWIVKDLRDEHKQAIDWLNEHTEERINFFAIKMEIWKIDDSAPAPKFQILSQPNDWSKVIRSTTTDRKLSETQLRQLTFWEELKEYGDQKSKVLKFRKPFPQHWYDFSIGTSQANITLICDTQNDLIRCELYIHDNKELYRQLEAKKGQIESEVGFELEWYLLESKKASRIKLSRSADLDNTEKWPEYIEWLVTNAEKFRRVFSKLI